MINYEKIKEINAGLTPMPLETKKGTKNYVPVNEQVKGFRMLCPAGTIKTEMSFINDKTVCFVATIFDDNGNTLATGTAYEVEGSTFINKTSYIENCETSAVGRALAFCGIGIDQSISSYEEVANAMLNQTCDKPTKPKPTKTTTKPNQTDDAGELVKRLLVDGAKKGYSKEDIKKFCKVNDLTELTVERLKKGIEFIATLNVKGEKFDAD